VCVALCARVTPHDPRFEHEDVLLEPLSSPCLPWPRSGLLARSSLLRCLRRPRSGHPSSTSLRRPLATAIFLTIFLTHISPAGATGVIHSGGVLSSTTRALLTIRNVREESRNSSTFGFSISDSRSMLSSFLDVGIRTAATQNQRRTRDRLTADSSSSSGSDEPGPSPFRSSYYDNSSRFTPGVPGITTSLLGNSGAGQRTSALYPSAQRPRTSQDYAPRRTSDDFARASQSYSRPAFGKSLLF
jgi:hypothetical protein